MENILFVNVFDGVFYGFTSESSWRTNYKFEKPVVGNVYGS